MDTENNDREAADGRRQSTPGEDTGGYGSLAKLSLGELLYRVLIGRNGSRAGVRAAATDPLAGSEA